MAADPDPNASLAQQARALMRAAQTACLASQWRSDLGGEDTDWPYASLVLSCLDHAGRPLLLLSDLAQHTMNIKERPEASILFDGTGGHADPLTGPRVTLVGPIAAIEDEASADRFVRRHPGAALYRGFADFKLYRMEPEKAHQVAGFGRIDWIDGKELVLPEQDCQTLAVAETDIIDHMNEDHADAVEVMAENLLGEVGSAEMIAVDPEGFDLRINGSLGRLNFDKRAFSAEACRVEIVRLTKRARSLKPTS